MISPFASTYSVWLITFWIQTLLQGCGMLQVGLYFHWYKNDSWRIKAMILALLITETFQSIVYFHATYIYLINGFGDFEALELTHWQDSAQLLATYLSAFIVQTYFGYCIYNLRRDDKIIPGIIFALALTQIVSGLAQTIRTLGLTSFVHLESTKAMTTVEAAAAFLCDVVITVSLVYNLGNLRTGIRSTNTLLETLMINAINRGTLTALCALLNLILFLALPGTFYFFIGLNFGGKLYMNSALASLNSRQYVCTKAHRAHPSWNGIAMAALEAQSISEGSGAHLGSIVFAKESGTIADSTSASQISTSTDGVV